MPFKSRWDEVGFAVCDTNIFSFSTQIFVHFWHKYCWWFDTNIFDFLHKYIFHFRHKYFWWKIPKITFYKMGDFWHFFAICILYLPFLFCISYFCLFVFLSFCLFSILFADARSGSPSPSERLTSNSRVASDHQNRHNHHQMSIRTQKRPKMSLGVLHANTRHKYANTQIWKKSTSAPSISETVHGALFVKSSRSA